jgi:signal transduction histidine kinase
VTDKKPRRTRKSPAPRPGAAATDVSRLRELAAEVLRGDHADRRRMARRVHDHLQQLLVASKFSATLLAREADATTRAEQGKKLMDLLDQAITESRALSAELAPPVLYQSGLGAALGWLGDQMQTKHGLEVEVQADEAAEPPTEEIKALLFQGARELLMGIASRGGKRAAVRLIAPNDHVRLSVEEPGPGEATDEVEQLRRRFDLIGGKLVRGPLGASKQGTRVELHAPPRAAAGG